MLSSCSCHLSLLILLWVFVCYDDLAFYALLILHLKKFQHAHLYFHLISPPWMFVAQNTYTKHERTTTVPSAFRNMTSIHLLCAQGAPIQRHMTKFWSDPTNVFCSLFLFVVVFCFLLSLLPSLHDLLSSDFTTFLEAGDILWSCMVCSPHAVFHFFEMFLFFFFLMKHVALFHIFSNTPLSEQLKLRPFNKISAGLNHSLSSDLLFDSLKEWNHGSLT